MPDYRDRGHTHFDESEYRRLAEIYADCFALILQLRSTDALGDPETLRGRTKELIKQAERKAERAGISREDARRASFAIVAFIDETILASDWQHKEEWMSRPLQQELFDRYDAGEEFFEKLETLRDDPGVHAEVLEVYYLCMTLGFKGKYQLHSQEQLRLSIEDVREQLSGRTDRRLRKLSPRALPEDQAVNEFKTKIPLWVIAVVALTIAALTYIGMSFYISGAESDVASEIQQLAQSGTLR